MARRILVGIATVIILAILIWMVTIKQEHHVKSSNEKEIVALGDSLTYGVGDSSGNGYAENLQKLLSKKEKGTVKVHNFGIPGQQTDGLLHQLGSMEVKGELSQADNIILFIGTNDLVKSNGGDLNPLQHDRIMLGKADYKKNLKRILNIIREENLDAPILFLGLYNPYPDSDKIEKVVENWNETSRAFIKPYDHIKFIQTNGLFKEKTSKYFSDSLHPNKRGYDVLTKKILNDYDFE
ncbi:DUF459 domain-containing protein [Falsibacillus albus]|uniref:SGNH hydrolase-type esterase domain-containing protein n=1 Tax=Falsibacillus albus TaxID=2478915 RepID=A0A3L7JVB7_9BACI|nr:GDSL-type esterase/lipase family protein [Falsibacillus albus]RLQ94245.1 hypothetical protein D9X91_14365 [Falsibacillus albus]